MPALTLTFNDPQTIALLLQYKQFLQQEGIDGTLQEVAAGLIVGSMDENPAFTRWTKQNKLTRNNVTPLPARSVASQEEDSGARRAIVGR